MKAYYSYEMEITCPDTVVFWFNAGAGEIRCTCVAADDHGMQWPDVSYVGSVVKFSRRLFPMSRTKWPR